MGAYLSARESAGVVELIVLVRELQEELIARTEAATVRKSRAEMLADRLALVESKLLALAAPAESPPDGSGELQPAGPNP